MIDFQSFTFNPFQENTYLLFDETNSVIIIDPGCYTSDEEKELTGFIDANNLKPLMLLNTHCHIDHVLGNAFVFKKYNLRPIIHSADLPILKSLGQYGRAYGFKVEDSPEPLSFLDDLDEISFGNSCLEIKHIPGHAPGHVVFIDNQQKNIFGGDVLFNGSVGRTDLPYGDHDTLIKSIKQNLLTMDDDYVVYPGHGPSTNIGFEKKNNPFLK